MIFKVLFIIKKFFFYFCSKTNRLAPTHLSPDRGSVNSRREKHRTRMNKKKTRNTLDFFAFLVKKRTTAAQNEATKKEAYSVLVFFFLSFFLLLRFFLRLCFCFSLLFTFFSLTYQPDVVPIAIDDISITFVRITTSTTITTEVTIIRIQRINASKTLFTVWS